MLLQMATCSKRILVLGWAPPGCWSQALLHTQPRHRSMLVFGSWVHQISRSGSCVVDADPLVYLVRHGVIEEFLCFEATKLLDCLKFLKELPWLLSISFVAGRQGGKDGDDEDHCTTDKLWMEEGLTNTIQITKRVIEEQSRNIFPFFSYFPFFERLFHLKSHTNVQT